MKQMIFGVMTLILTLLAGSVWAGTQDDLENLGGLLYKDKNLSLNKNQSCMTCHHPSAGFADPVNMRDPDEFPVSEGSILGEFGGRNAPSAAYAGFSPIFDWNDTQKGYVGGMFWDGRATGETLDDPLAEQAQGPPLNDVEMAMPDKAAIIDVIKNSVYYDLWMRVFNTIDNVDVAYDNFGRAIAAYERATAVTQFNSKFDQFWAACQKSGIDVSNIDTTTVLATLPSGILTVTQLQGLALFNDEGKGNCAACHSTSSDYIDEKGKVYPELFTDFTYHNLGIPVNQRLYDLSGGEPPDYGLGGREDIAAKDPDGLELGKFKVPTLRNVAKSAPYGHNGYFPTLNAIVNFHNTRDVADWGEAEVPENVNTEQVGNLGLTPKEEWQIVAFLKALTDQK